MNQDNYSTSDKRLVLLITMFGAFLTPFMSSSVTVALPSIGKDFSMSAVVLSWVAASYLLTAASFLLPFGRLADIYGRKRIFSAGTALFTLASLLCAVSASAPLLIAFRIVQGIAGAMLMSTSVAILTSVFHSGERGKVLGLNVASTYTGLSAGPFLGGLLTYSLGWRSIFFAVALLGLFAFVLVRQRLTAEWTEARGEKFDITGTLISIVSFALLMYGFTILPSTRGIGLLGLGLAGMAAFGVWEIKTENPLIDIPLFRTNTVFVFSNIAALINYSATFAVSFLVSLYLQYIKGFDPRQAGLILVIQPLLMAIFSPLAGRLSDSIEPRLVSSAGMLLTSAGLFLFIFLGKNTSLLYISLSLFILGLGFALFSSPNTHAVMASVEKKYYGVASGTLGAMRLTGQTLSMAITMMILALSIGRAQVTPYYYPAFLNSTSLSFALFTGLCLAGTAASLARGTMHGKP